MACQSCSEHEFWIIRISGSKGHFKLEACAFADTLSNLEEFHLQSNDKEPHVDLRVQKAPKLRQIDIDSTIPVKNFSSESYPELERVNFSFIEGVLSLKHCTGSKKLKYVSFSGPQIDEFSAVGY
ncbi:hypothetical protein DASC09_052250 [Saccharomycopsis crataegensis]|uniref:Uncharacterized protein n=1 Tax=Saccharomycopsis crataegensis TaxID=43959 RepID=A0AAV5QSJ9_9ASCO|nr:hypothetical protein DASC09_052250 [Saccharomycopsis crataegensis]